MSRPKLTITASAVFTLLHACGPVSGASEAEKITAQLEQIYQANKDSQDREIVAAASVISTLIGAIQSRRTLELSDFVLPFSKSEVDRLQGRDLVGAGVFRNSNQTWTNHRIHSGDSDDAPRWVAPCPGAGR